MYNKNYAPEKAKMTEIMHLKKLNGLEKYD